MKRLKFIITLSILLMVASILSAVIMKENPAYMTTALLFFIMNLAVFLRKLAEVEHLHQRKDVK